MVREEIVASVEALTSKPIAFQALWDGDSGGWFIRFSAITEDEKEHGLGILSGGGDLRIFNGQVPPWPEAVVAQQLGSELAERYEAQFYFPSPHYPEDQCPDWSVRDQGYPCRCCGILLLQREPCPWRGCCYHCHLAAEREQREAQWTPEERAGPRCHICGKPAKGELNGAPACVTCLDKYEVYNCARCGTVTMLSKSIEHTYLCSLCEIKDALDLLTEAQRQTIIEAMEKDRFEAVDVAIEVMGCSWRDARIALIALDEQNANEEDM